MRVPAWLRSGLLLLPLLATGCSTIEGYPVRWPWTKTSMLAEKYDVPPENDSRYSNPPTYPKSTMTPELKAESTTRPGNRFGSAGLGSPGMSPAGPGMR